MTNDQKEMREEASRNARTVEEMLLTTADVVALTQDEAADVVDRCEQIIHCMRECHDA